MAITRDSSLREVAFAVCTALDRVGVTAVLTGGSAATLYAPQAIQSFHLDFVLESPAVPRARRASGLESSRGVSGGVIASQRHRPGS